MNITTPAAPDGLERHAQALSEIKQMHLDFKAMQTELIAARRTIDQQANMVELLKEERDRLYQEGRVHMRKLVRLAAAMSGMSRLAADADEIMRSVQEWQETTTEDGLRDIEDIFTALPEGAK